MCRDFSFEAVLPEAVSWLGGAAASSYGGEERLGGGEGDCLGERFEAERKGGGR